MIKKIKTPKTSVKKDAFFAPTPYRNEIIATTPPISQTPLGKKVTGFLNNVFGNPKSVNTVENFQTNAGGQQVGGPKRFVRKYGSKKKK
tara:strand:+ start:4476 stop:4742 length:267 start_codon:yes stop_codon:yes gene_type:complete